jgi:hypothetical protein
MTADSTVAEIEASGRIALGIKVDVQDHEVVEAMVTRVVQEWVGSMCSSRMLAEAVVGPWIQRPAPSIRRSCSLSWR